MGSDSIGNQRIQSSPAPFFDANCTRCARLVAYLAQTRETHPDYHAAPVPPFGDPAARLLIVGLAPGLHGANATGRPFTGDHAGILLYQTLHRFGFASGPQSTAGDALHLLNCRITNAVKCVPPANKPSTAEIVNCNSYLAREIEALTFGSVLIALGRIAHDAIARALGLPLVRFKFAHDAEHEIPDRGLRVIDSYHCSRYNTQTGRLTGPMFERVFVHACRLLER